MMPKTSYLLMGWDWSSQQHWNTELGDVQSLDVAASEIQNQTSRVMIPRSLSTSYLEMQVNTEGGG